MTYEHPSADSGIKKVEWRKIFNHAYKTSIEFNEGDALPHGSVVSSIKAITTSIGDSGSAARAIEKAVQNGQMKKSDGKYSVVYEGVGTGEIRKSLTEKLQTLMTNGEDAVIKAPTSSGKTYAASTTRWRSCEDTTGGQPVILFSGTTDARDDAFSKSESSSASAKCLYGRGDACPVARGDYDSDNDKGNSSITAPDGSEPSKWFRDMCNDRGLPLSVAHGEFKRRCDGQMPCCDADDCLSSTQWEGIPTNDDDEVEYDVLHATHNFAQVPRLIEDCNVIIDERPDFTIDLTTAELRKTVNSYLTEIEAPIQRWEELAVGLVGNIDTDEELSELEDALEAPDTEWFQDGIDAHALTPGIVKAIVSAKERNHGRWVGEVRHEYPVLNEGYDGPKHEVIIRVVIDSDYDVRLIQSIPDFYKARSVIGLDAHPTLPKWKAYTTTSIELEQIVSSEELHKWRRNQRDLHIVQVGDNKNTWTKKDYNHEKVGVICAKLSRKYGDDFRTGVTANAFESDLRRQLGESGVDSPDTIHFGAEKSVEDFSSERIGLIAGCISPSSDHIKDWIALLDKDTAPKREVYEYYQGQAWVGPDANVARAILGDIQRDGVLQACGRYARSPQDPDDEATVYVMTNVLPDEYVDEKIDDVNLLGKKQKQVLNYLLEPGRKETVSEISENISTDVSKKHIHSTLGELSEQPFLNIEKEAGSYNADLFSADYCPEGVVDI